ncbi:MAG: CotH kinase family protein [Bacteroidales bacterium]
MTLLLPVIFHQPVLTQDIVINEICTKNSHVISDNDYTQFVDWIEIYNSGQEAVNLFGYFVTDDSLNSTKWEFTENTIIGSNEYLILWADDKNITVNGIHTNFKLSSDGGCVCIFDPDTSLIDKLIYGEQYTDISFGKAANGLAWFATPTPLAANNTAAYFSSQRNEPPQFSILSGFYNSNSELTMNTPSGGNTIRFTSDGSYPTENSEIYTGPILLTEIAVIRAKTFGDLLPSEETTHSYLIEVNKDIPVVSLIIDPDFLWSFEIGIFNDSLISQRTDWERSSVFQYFKSNQLAFEAANNIRLFGATAYLLPQKSFAVMADTDIEYQIFDCKPLSVFDSFIMRSSSDDWSKTMFRDGMVHTIVQDKLNIDYQAYQPTVLYINGEYFGIFNLREKLNEDYLKNNHSINKDSIDLIKLNYWKFGVEVLAGSDETFFDLIDYLNNNDLTDDEVFAGVSEFLNVDNYTNYVITQICIGNRSYNHNIKTWRQNDITDGFKWLIYDTDRSFMDSWRDIFQQVYDDDPIFSKLLTNLNHRNHYLQQTSSHMNVTFRKSYIDHLIDSLGGNIESEMPYHIERWAPYGGVESMANWGWQKFLMSKYTKEIKDSLFIRLNEFYSLDGMVSVNLKKSHPNGGRIYIEDVLIPYNDSIHSYFKNIPVKLVAKANLGYNFIDWEGIAAEDSLYYTFTDDQVLHARFEPNCELPNTISNDFMLVNACSPYMINEDVVIDSGATLYCEPGVEIMFGEDIEMLVNGSLSFIGSANEPIIIRGQQGLFWKFIKSENGSIHFSNVELHSGEKAISFTGGNIQIENCTFFESNKDQNDLISGSLANVIFRNNVFFGQPNNDKRDCIDCKNIPSGEFTGNVFYDVSDDCIDIGNNSTSISIENNEMYNCKSMGISIGESTTASLVRNIIAHCNGGIQVHTDAIAQIINNTLYANDIGIRCFHNDNNPNTGGHAFVTNTIFSECMDDYLLQSSSSIEINFSLSDMTLHNGNENLHDDPLFVNPDADDFNLQFGSPCIDAGDTFSPLDPDFTRTDMGARYYDQSNNIEEYQRTISLYPNPFSGTFYIEIPNGVPLKKIEVYDLDGKSVYTNSQIIRNKQIIAIPVKGLMILSVTDINDIIYYHKIISQ